MSEAFTVRKANEKDITLLYTLIQGLAAYEKRPQDMTASQEALHTWLFKKKIATALIAEYEQEPVGYAIYYPVFGSFAAEAGVHLEDMYLQEKSRHGGLGTKFFAKIVDFVQADGYSGMEWSCLDWNASAIGFYHKIGAKQETGRVYYHYPCKEK